MKLLRISLLSMLALILSFRYAWADNNVDLEQARDVAAYAIAIEMGNDKYDIADARLVYQINNPILNIPAAYFFNVGNNAFVIVAGHKSSMPLIGMSADDTLQVSKMPPAMQWWVESYSEMIVDAQLMDLEPTGDAAKQWAAYENHSYTSSTGKATNWLIDDKWGQGSNYNPTFNLYCPVHYHQYCYTGCGPTALAQIVHYYEFPEVGRFTKAYYPTYTVDGETGIRTSPTATTIYFNQTHYDYANMPNVLNYYSDSVQIKATALLMFHIGVAVDAQYGIDGTSVYSESVTGPMKRYFMYKNSSQLYRSSIGTDKWLDTLRYSIDRKAPLYFSASSPIGEDIHANGHAFICHGYHPSQTNLFRMNWGWDGGSDGWYNMADINGLDPSSYCFSTRQAVLMGLVPPDSNNRHLTIHETATNVLHAAYPNPANYQVTVPYSLQQDNNAVLEIYDATGRQMEQRVLTPGEGMVRINVTAYPKGLYFYRLQGGVMHKFVVQ